MAGRDRTFHRPITYSCRFVMFFRRYGLLAGAPFVLLCSANDPQLAQKLAEAIRYPGFSMINIWGECPGATSKASASLPGRLPMRWRSAPL